MQLLLNNNDSKSKIFPFFFNVTFIINYYQIRFEFTAFFGTERHLLSTCISIFIVVTLRFLVC